jgi:hypothetical protein
MDREYLELLGRVVTIQADCEIGSPPSLCKRYTTLRSHKIEQLIVARTAAEEIDHFRKIARVAAFVLTRAFYDVSNVLRHCLFSCCAPASYSEFSPPSPANALE